MHRRAGLNDPSSSLLPVCSTTPSECDWTEHTDTIGDNLSMLRQWLHRCAESSAPVPRCTCLCPLRRGNPVGKYFAYRTEPVANPLTMSRKCQRMTTRPSCPTTPLLIGWSHSCGHVTCLGPIRRPRKNFPGGTLLTTHWQGTISGRL